MQHDKARDIKTACSELALQSDLCNSHALKDLCNSHALKDLCNSHALKALKEKIISYPDLKIFINPILPVLKSVKLSRPVWCNNFKPIYIMIFQLLVLKQRILSSISSIYTGFVVHGKQRLLPRQHFWCRNKIGKIHSC